MSYRGRNGLFRKKGVSINCAPAHGTVKGQSYTRSTLVAQNFEQHFKKSFHSVLVAYRLLEEPEGRRFGYPFPVQK